MAKTKKQPNDTGIRPIIEIAGKVGLGEADLEFYGPYKAKVGLESIRRLERKPNSSLILVSAMTPTPAGEGKTTVSVGLTQALARLGKSVVAALREPSLGPVFGVKGGATGGGCSRVIPMEDINLHFTNDFPAVESAHNLLSALLDNSIFHGNPLNIDPRKITWRRVVDMNDRYLRDIVIGLGGSLNGVPRETGFDIVPSSEIMAILCLSRSYNELKDKIRKILLSYTYDDKPIVAGDLKVGGRGDLAPEIRPAAQPGADYRGCAGHPPRRPVREHHPGTTASWQRTLP